MGKIISLGSILSISLLLPYSDAGARHQAPNLGADADAGTTSDQGTTEVVASRDEAPSLESTDVDALDAAGIQELADTIMDAMYDKVAFLEHQVSVSKQQRDMLRGNCLTETVGQVMGNIEDGELSRAKMRRQLGSDLSSARRHLRDILQAGAKTQGVLNARAGCIGSSDDEEEDDEDGTKKFSAMSESMEVEVEIPSLSLDSDTPEGTIDEVPIENRPQSATPAQ